jgi:MFS family permease
MIATLRRPSFTLLWLGGLISLAGDWVLSVGLPIYIFLLTRSVLATSLMLLASSVPNVLLGSIAGVFVDRWDRKRTMVITNALLALGLLPLLLVRSLDHVWIVYVVAVVESCVEQFFTPAKNAVLPTLVGEELLVPANSLNSLSNTLARLIGPALGGLIAGFFGLNGIVLADAASFALAALLIAFITVPPRKAAPVGAFTEPLAAAEAGAVKRVWREWVDGLRVIRHERTLAVLLAVYAITSLGEGVFGVLYPVFVYKVLHGIAPQIGELMTAQAIGGLLGGLLVGRAGRRITSRWVIGFCSILFGLIDLAIFNAPSLYATFGLAALFPLFWFAAGLFVAVGVPGIAMSTGVQSLMQARAPEAYRGRVFGALGMTIGLLGLIGQLTAGTVTDHLGVVTVLNVQGAGYVVAGLLILWLLPRRPHKAAASAAPATAAVPEEVMG